MVDEADPVEEVAVEPVAAVEPVPTPEPIAEPELALEPTPTPEPTRPEVPRWTLERIGEETSKRQTAEEKARQAEERANSLEEIIKRMQADPKPADPATVTRQETRQAVDQSAIDRAAQAQLFQRDLQNVSDSGIKAYGAKWTDAVNALNAFGANTPEFVSSVMDVDQFKTHEIMFQIAQDGEQAVRLAKMTPNRRIAEITRMVMADVKSQKAADDNVPPASKTVTPAVSRAPTPKPAIAPHVAAPEVDPMTPEGNDKISDAQFEQWYKSKYMKRTG